MSRQHPSERSRFAPDRLILMSPLGAEERLRHWVPGVHPLLRNLAARIVTDPRATSDAALILADYLREITEAQEAASGEHYPNLGFLIGILTDCAPYLRGGAKEVVR